jgi:hypothetical protein
MTRSPMFFGHGMSEGALHTEPRLIQLSISADLQHSLPVLEAVVGSVDTGPLNSGSCRGELWRGPHQQRDK